jgi:hypothetical protein
MESKKIFAKNDWFTPIGLEEELGIKVSTQNKLRMRKAIPYSKVGNFIWYSRAKINQWLEDAEVLS